MCGRYSLNDAEKMLGRFKVKSVDFELSNNFNVAPTQTMPVIAQDATGRRLELMRWGIPRHISKDVEKMIINTKSEKAFSPFWKKTVMNHRVLIPATSFFEWKLGSTPKQPYRIFPKHEDMFAFAGIWSTWKNTDGKDVNVYSIMTTEPNKEMTSVHNRMPVILHQQDEENWLSPSHNEDRNTIEALLRPYEDNGLELLEASRDVNNVRNNNAELILPINSQ